jgi:hypothetical protein
MWAHPLPGVEHNFTTLAAVMQQRRAGYASLGLRAVALLQGGWLLTWVQGPRAACEQALREAEQAAQPFRTETLLQAPTAELLRDAWSIVWRHAGRDTPGLREGAALVRLQARAGMRLTPMDVWRRVSSHPSRSAARSQAAHPAERVLLLSRDVTLALRLVSRVAHELKAAVVSSRLAGTGTQLRDVAASYTDLVNRQGQGVSLQTIARAGLRLGLVRLLLSDFGRVALLLPNTRPSDASAMVGELADACAVTAMRPLVLAVTEDAAVVAAVSQACRTHGLPMRSVVLDAHDVGQAWQAIQPLVDHMATTVPLTQ